MFSQIRNGWLREPTTPFGRSDCVQGVVESSAGNKVAIVKRVEPYQLAREVLSSLLADGLSLPIPEGFVVDVSQTKWGDDHGIRFAYGSTFIDRNRLSRATRDSAEVTAQLCRWKNLLLAFSFDEFVNNSDRTHDNLVFSRGQFYLIDHAEIMPNYEGVTHLRSNFFKPYVMRALPGLSPQQLAERVLESCSRFGSIDFDELRRAGEVEPLIAGASFAGCVKFLSERLNHLPELVHQQLGTGQQPLNLEGPTA